MWGANARHSNEAALLSPQFVKRRWATAPAHNASSTGSKDNQRRKAHIERKTRVRKINIELFLSLIPKNISSDTEAKIPQDREICGKKNNRFNIIKIDRMPASKRISLWETQLGKSIVSFNFWVKTEMHAEVEKALDWLPSIMIESLDSNPSKPNPGWVLAALMPTGEE